MRLSRVEGGVRVCEKEIEDISAEGTPEDAKGGGEGDESTSTGGERTTELDLLARQTDEELKDRNKSMTIRLAAEIHRKRQKRIFSAKNGGKRTFNLNGNSLRDALEGSLDVNGRIDWRQIYRAMNYLEERSDRYEQKDHRKHGRILVLTPSSEPPNLPTTPNRYYLLHYC